MWRKPILLLMLAMTLANCGVRRPLVRPEAIPALEEKRQQDAKKFHPPGEEPPDADLPDDKD